MIKSQYISDILDLVFDGEDGFPFRKQLPFLTVSEYEYTKAGVFVSFFNNADNKTDYVTFNASCIDGVSIKSNTHELEANATVFISNGLIDYLEIWCYSGEYPKEDLKEYTLTQTWKGSNEKKIIRE